MMYCPAAYNVVLDPCPQTSGVSNLFRRSIHTRVPRLILTTAIIGFVTSSALAGVGSLPTTRPFQSVSSKPKPQEPAPEPTKSKPRPTTSTKPSGPEPQVEIYIPSVTKLVEASARSR